MADSASALASVTTDPQARVAPALSATSDAPVITSEAAAPDANATPDPKPDATDPAPDAGADPANTDPPDPDPQDGQTAKPREEIPAYAKREITKARNQKRESDARALAAEAKANESAALLRKTLDVVEKLTGESSARAAKAVDAADPRPKRDAFDNPETYDSALIEWAGRSAAHAATAAAEATAADKAKQETADREKAENETRNQEIRNAFTKRKEAFVADHPDYADVAESDDLQISIPMAQTIMQDDDGPAIAYYLGQNPDEALRISKLPGVSAAAELGRIAAKLNAKPTKTPKPAPITPLTAGAASATRKSADDESMDEYGARRLAEIRAAARGNGSGATH